MVKTRFVPPGARRLRTYTELESYISDFVAGRYPFLWIVGRPGVAKTESLKTAVKGHAHLYRKGGQLTAGVGKLVPAEETLERAYRRAYRVAHAGRAVEDALARVEVPDPPAGLAARLADAVKGSEDPWDEHLYRIAEKDERDADGGKIRPRIQPG